MLEDDTRIAEMSCASIACPRRPNQVNSARSSNSLHVTQFQHADTKNAFLSAIRGTPPPRARAPLTPQATTGTSGGSIDLFVIGSYLQTSNQPRGEGEGGGVVVARNKQRRRQQGAYCHGGGHRNRPLVLTRGSRVVTAAADIEAAAAGGGRSGVATSDRGRG